MGSETIKAYAVLIDTVSIQQYIFGSNKMKENIGASFIVEKIFDDVLRQVLPDGSEYGEMVDLWKKEPEIVYLYGDKPKRFEIGYIGGGNALLFFRDKSGAIDFVKNWTRELLVEAPGLRTAIVIQEYLGNSDFRSFLNNAFLSLQENKSKYIRNVQIPKLALAKDCQYSNLAAEALQRTPDGAKYISENSKIKLEHSDSATNKLEDYYKKELKNEWVFTSEIDRLGQIEGDSYVAVVHIDGNHIGRIFNGINSLVELRKLSLFLSEITKKAFGKLIELITGLQNLKEEDGFKIVTEREKRFLPIRSIVLGGDDITFVCHGKLALFLAESYILEWIAKPWVFDGESVQLSACAGIAIIKTKYPFYRAYLLASDLCKKAKIESRKYSYIGENWLQFHVHKQAATIQYNDVCDFSFGPYNISGNLCDQNIYHLKQGISDFRRWPKSKIAELRERLQSLTSIRGYIEEINSRGLVLPDSNYSNLSYKSEGVVDRKTPFLDMIEMIDFYPEFLIDRKGEENDNVSNRN
jgi:hypothetical protein